ncbi:class I SAM-dependent methyltransferase [Cellulophaga baltica]|uniref:class I SAM-dependent methyltransferase n=1 Tax=Cellulophaga TaxID=104264 RepID=UPI001C0716BC|nr:MULTISPECIES: class I SAM-dependent methyltransferase [Cellulophaga]MBU2997017.1 class I SAM-dependent methyltransferase [Cellulophaga baltica]MDO6768415.1 class I SAM-dependent methyltransferase [Cellulophaga sp. 1_MG-2023]
MPTDILGNAVLDFQNKKHTADIITYSSLDEEDTIPVPYLFRDYKNMPKLEQNALALCKGDVLDIGCGAGSHSLYLQEKGHNVIALDYSAGAIEVCKKRGVKNVVCSNIYDYSGRQYDTLLLLMNGIGLAGKLNQLNKFFNHLKSLLKPNGQIILDSSDIIYMFQEDEDGGYWIPDNDYYGEVTFNMEYKNQKSEAFDWLYIDYNTLQRAAIANNFNCKLVFEGEHYDYLATLSLIV